MNATWVEPIHLVGPRELVGSHPTSATVSRAIFVIFLRLGLVLVQIGSIPTENFYRILQQNLLDVAVSIPSYAFLGFPINHGPKTLEGFLGYGASMDSDSSQISHHQAGHGLCAVLVGSGVITTVLSVRLHAVAVWIVSFVYSGVLYPMVSHWLLAERGWMQAEAEVEDYAAGLAVHATAGTFAAVGAVFLGRRLLRLRDVDEISVGADSAKNTFVGYLFVIMGLLVLSLPTPEEEFRLKRPKDGVLFINGILGLSGAGLVAACLDVACNGKVNYWSVIKYLQAAVAGLVALSCSIDSCSPIVAFTVGLAAGVLFFLVSTIVDHSFIEDYSSAIATHFACSFLASFVAPLLAKDSDDLPVRIAWQMACYFIILTASALLAILVFSLLCLTPFLRNSEEKLNHRRATLVARSRRAKCGRLFAVQSGTMFLQPDTPRKTVLKTEVNVIRERSVDQEFVDADTNGGVLENYDSAPSRPDRAKKFRNLQKRMRRLTKPYF